MTDVAALIADMVRAGVDPDIIGRTAAALAAPKSDLQAERRRAADRERKRLARLRNSAESAESADMTPSPEVPSEVSPTPPSYHPPNPNPITPFAPLKGGSSPAGFDEFWALYPNKVGKADALKAYVKATARADIETIMAGLRRYVAKTDDRPWCNPATWLNQDRWADEPATVVPASRAPPRPNPLSDFFGSLDRGKNDPIDITPASGSVRYLPAAGR